MKKIVAAKLHGIYITECELNYHGSITLDPDHCELAGIMPMEFVEIWNKQSGARISTYVIYGERGSNCCIVNGAAARTCQAGDQIIICSSDYRDASALTEMTPKVVTFERDNSVAEVLEYRTRRNARGWYDFEIVDLGTEEKQPIPLMGRAAS